MRKKKVTFADIAKYTGFSKTTISRYFNDPDSLTLENQEKIAKALDELDYQENKLAKVLANGKSEFVGIIIPNLYLHYYSEMLNQLLSSYTDYRYKFLVFVSSDQKELEQQYLDELMAYKIEGLIVLSHTFPSEKLASYHIPIVAIEREAEHICSVNTECEILIHVNVPVPKQVPAYNRIRGFEDTCIEHHVPYELMLQDFGSTYETTYEAIKKVFIKIDNAYPGKKKGVFLANDTYANIFLNLVFQKYGTLPQEYQIMGFDNSPIANESIIPISTLGQQIDQISKTAMELLILQMNEMKKRQPVPLSEPIHKQITPVLIRRNTTD